MKHRHSMRKLGRTSAHRWALLRNLVSQLVQHERIETTVPKVSSSYTARIPSASTLLSGWPSAPCCTRVSDVEFVFIVELLLS
jgi:hypothetical protein